MRRKFMSFLDTFFFGVQKMVIKNVTVMWIYIYIGRKVPWILLDDGLESPWALGGGRYSDWQGEVEKFHFRLVGLWGKPEPKMTTWSWLNMLLLMEEIRRSPVEVGSLSHYLQGFIHPRWCRISEPSIVWFTIAGFPSNNPENRHIPFRTERLHHVEVPIFFILQTLCRKHRFFFSKVIDNC